jgi:hypothetical protein
MIAHVILQREIRTSGKSIHSSLRLSLKFKANVTIIPLKRWCQDHYPGWILYTWEIDT